MKLNLNYDYKSVFPDKGDTNIYLKSIIAFVYNYPHYTSSEAFGEAPGNLL